MHKLQKPTRSPPFTSNYLEITISPPWLPLSATLSKLNNNWVQNKHSPTTQGTLILNSNSHQMPFSVHFSFWNETAYFSYNTKPQISEPPSGSRK